METRRGADIVARTLEALGGFGACVTDAADLPAALAAAQASRKPARLTVMIERVPARVIRRPG